MKSSRDYSPSASNPHIPSLTRSSSTNFTPLPVSQSRLPVPRGLKRSSSPELVADYENHFYSSSQPATPSPSKHGKVSEIVKQRLYSLTPSPLKVRTAVIGGIFSSNSNAQSTRRLSLNAYGIRSDLSPKKGSDSSHSNSNATGNHRRRSNLNSNVYSADQDRIKVCIRKRPLSQKEVQSNHQDILELNPAAHCAAVLEDRVRLDGISRYTERHEFIFDRVFDVNSTNRQIYASCIQELVDTVISGGKATCFAYGQTGSGKTHTMLNPEDGLNHLAAYDLFQQAALNLSNVSIHVTFYEIYQNSLYDLLNQKRRVMACEGRNGEVHIVGITEIAVESAQHLQQIMQDALNTRSTGSTAANSTSSRSHAILQFILRKDSSVHGKFSFIDLAGSERGSDRANVDKQTRLEGAEINKSLLALKECIRAIDQDSSHLPFRQSKLTLVLKDSFTGNAKTCMIATVSPSSANCEHTINTLRYADRVKELKGPSNLVSEVYREIREIPCTVAKMDADHVFDKQKDDDYVFEEDLLINENHDDLEIIENREDLLINEDHDDLLINEDHDDLILIDSSPLKLTESDDSFLLSTFPTSQQSNTSATSTKKSTKPAMKLKESLHHSIAVLYDRVSNCNDADLLELLGDELDGLLAAFNK